MKFGKSDTVYVIYWLFNEEQELLYIGKTSVRRLKTRIAEHCKQKDFTFYSFDVVGVDHDEVYRVEKPLFKNTTRR